MLADQRPPLPRSVSAGAGQLARRQPSADRHQLVEYAGARAANGLVAVGTEFLPYGRGPDRGTLDDRCAPRHRHAAGAGRTEPVALLQPEHSPPWRRPGVVRRGPGAAGARRQRSLGTARAAGAGCRARTADRPRRRPRRALDPLSSLRARFLHPGARRGTVERRSGGGRARVGGRQRRPRGPAACRRCRATAACRRR